MRGHHLFAAWAKVRNRIAIADHIVLLSDFDGTLAPICSRPSDARMSAKVRQLLRRIRRSGTTVAIVSGRALEDVSRRVALRGVWYVGGHGYALRSPGGRTIYLSTPAERRRILHLCVALKRKLEDAPGIEIEPKSATIAVHYRRAGQRERDAARHLLAGLVTQGGGVKLLEGKKVWEILPNRQVDKWTAVQFILRRASKGRGSSLLTYLGDDRTDEAVFRRMKGISIAVGKRRRTAARFYLRSPGEVCQFFERWVGILR
jgi:trehalose-phosphatase